MSALMSPPPASLLHLVVRFNNSLSDLLLTIPSPSTTATATLRQLVRSRLLAPYSAARLRLIYAGKVLNDSAPLSLSLGIAPRPPPRDVWHPGPGDGWRQTTGKEPARDSEAGRAGMRGETWGEAHRIYVHCAVGDALSAATIAEEAAQARLVEAWLQKPQRAAPEAEPWFRPHSLGLNLESALGVTPTPPQGFDRLLASGFTVHEVGSLRETFRNNLSYTHTPETMPSPTTQRALEERWLDSAAHEPVPSAGPSALDEGGGGGGSGGSEPGWGTGFGAEDGGLDDLVLGYLTGFFWPAAALVLGFREEGVWSRRRQLAVVMGVVLNAALGFLRWSA